jgi:NAD(P)-dependent dehydrogenase (short-subunit alcohol dehydrogenase family)
MQTLQLHSFKSVFILGASGAIGAALCEVLLEKTPRLQIYSLSRGHVKDDRVISKEVEVIDESSIGEFLEGFPGLKFDLVINAIGYLENHLGGPEKGLREINEEKLLEYFRVNAVITPVLAKLVRNRLSPVFGFVALSAMVGSITENHLGGWYGYRASKAALNMFIKNISLEWKRSNPHCLVLAIHPGTTHSRLSEKYSRGVTHKIHTPRESAQNILEIIFTTSFENTGSFLNWDGRTIEW